MLCGVRDLSFSTRNGTRALLWECSVFITGPGKSLRSILFIYFERVMFIHPLFCVWLQQVLAATRRVVVESAGSSAAAPRLWVGACRLSSYGPQAKPPHNTRDLGSLSRDRTQGLGVAKWILNLWTTREVPFSSILNFNVGLQISDLIFLKATESTVIAEVLKRQGMKCKAVLKTKKQRYWNLQGRKAFI